MPERHTPRGRRMTSTGSTDRHDRAWGRWTARPKPSVCSSQAGTTTPAVPRGGVASPPDSPPFVGSFVLTQRRPLVRFSGGRVGARGAKNALMSHVGRLEVVRWTVLSRLALCLMVKIVCTHAARSDMERRRALRNEGGLAVGAAENVGVRRFVDDLSQHVARAEAGSVTNFGNHDGSLRSIMRPSRLVTNPALAATPGVTDHEVAEAAHQATVKRWRTARPAPCHGE